MTKKIKGFYIMQRTIEVKHLSRVEKLRVMEAIWEDLSREDEEVESPGWHQEALQETERRHSERQEKFVDWQVAKKELRNRFE
ncbi:addiction module protein [Dehalococcoidia bacterium]|nr:addiction module protein [Dehalococcoidia bacterium]